jgi:site-specific DNA-methyltransferase (adenine-specific)
VKPYYEHGGISIFLGDCREVLPELGKVDLVLTDPPFFMPATHYQSRVGWQRTWGDTSILRVFWEVITDAYCPRMKDTAHALVFCSHESYPVFYPVMYSKFHYLKSIIWDKGHVGLGRIWRNQHELIIAARWNDGYENKDDRLRADVLRHNATPSQSREHPVEKPSSLLADLILPTTPDDGMVLDPFMGSGTTLVAAKELGRKAIGIEIEEKYCEIAIKRLEQEILPFERGE